MSAARPDRLERGEPLVEALVGHAVAPREEVVPAHHQGVIDARRALHRHHVAEERHALELLLDLLPLLRRSRRARSIDSAWWTM